MATPSPTAKLRDDQHNTNTNIITPHREIEDNNLLLEVKLPPILTKHQSLEPVEIKNKLESIP